MVMGGALIATVIQRSEFVKAYKIPSVSMTPTLLVGDDLLANKFVHGINIPFFNRKIFILISPHKGDIIVFRSPEDPRRDESCDSRFYGFADLRDAEGKVFVVYWSWDNETTLPRFNRIGLRVK